MKPLLFALLGAASLSACAQSPAPAATAARPGAQADAPATADAVVVPGTPESRARDAIRRLNPQVKIERVDDAPIAGFSQVIVGGQVVYVSDDGRYLLQGTLLDVAEKKDMGEAALSQLRRELLATIPAADHIVFAPADPKYTVTVFTDVECGYCRKLHGEIAEYNRQGIAVEYLAFPRMGPGSPDFDKMVAVWCAADPRQALTAAKNDKAVSSKPCTNPVRMQYDLGQRMGLTGTPMILAVDGTQLGGYVPPLELRAKLDQRAAQDAAPEAVANAAAGGR